MDLGFLKWGAKLAKPDSRGGGGKINKTYKIKVL